MPCGGIDQCGGRRTFDYNMYIMFNELMNSKEIDRAKRENNVITNSRAAILKTLLRRIGHF